MSSTDRCRSWVMTAAAPSAPVRGIPSARRLALKDTDRLTIGVLGDGDYLMGVSALWTASHFEIPVMIVVADNRSYFNDEMHQERVAQMRSRPPQNRWIGQRIDDPRVDLVAMARAQGFDSEDPVSTTEALGKSAQKRC